MSAELSVVVPVYQDGAKAGRILDEIGRKIGTLVKEVVFVYDRGENGLLSPLRRIAESYLFPVRFVRNEWGQGSQGAVRTGLEWAEGPMVLTWTKGLDDDLARVPQMVERMRRGADVVCGSRFISGGRHQGGSPAVWFLSRLFGWGLHHTMGVPAHDVTSGLHLYHKTLLDRLDIEAVGDVEVGVEVVVKTFSMGGRIGETPIVRNERASRASLVELRRWLVGCCKWSWYAVRNCLSPVEIIDSTLPGSPILSSWDVFPAQRIFEHPPIRRRLAG